MSFIGMSIPNKLNNFDTWFCLLEINTSGLLAYKL